MARTPTRLRDAPWAADVEVAAADVTDADSLREALEDVDVAYYLVHSIGAKPEFEDEDRAGGRRRSPSRPRRPASGASSTSAASRRRARSCRRTCAAARRSAASCSTSGVPTTVLQAAVVIGSGSASFEMLRHLTERLPVMVVPKWVDTQIQPIAIRDVLRYLVGGADLPADVNRALRHRRPRRPHVRAT